MRGRRGQNRKKGRFRENLAHRGGMRTGDAGFPEKSGCHTSIFLQLSKYEEARPPPRHPLRRPFFRYRGRAAPANRASAAFRSPHRDGRRGNPGRARHSRLHPFASSGKAPPGWAGGGTAGGNLLVVFGEHGCAARGAGISLRGMLHAESRGAHGSDRADFEVME